MPMTLPKTGPARLALVNHVLIALFGISSGAYKAMGGEADIRVFAALGMSASVVAVFGVVQAMAALGTVPLRSRRGSAWLLAACNLLASAGLFAAGVTTFAVVSLLFVVSAWWVSRHGDGAGHTRSQGEPTARRPTTHGSHDPRRTS